MAAIHIIGQITEAFTYGLPSSLPLRIESTLSSASGKEDDDSPLEIMSGTSTSKSVMCIPLEGYVWNHSLNFHIGIKTSLMVARIRVKLLTEQGMTVAVGSCGIQLRPGIHNYTCSLASAQLERLNQMKAVFLHEFPTVEDSNMSSPCGSVNIEIGIIGRSFDGVSIVN
jgi:hypothetical protein